MGNSFSNRNVLLLSAFPPLHIVLIPLQEFVACNENIRSVQTVQNDTEFALLLCGWEVFSFPDRLIIIVSRQILK